MTEQKRREDVPAEHQWNLALTFETEEMWKANFKEVKEQIPSLSYDNLYFSTPDEILESTKAILNVSRKLEKLYVYAARKHDQDLENSHHQGLYNKIKQLYTEFGTTTSYFEPEILSIPEEHIQSWLKDGSLEPYNFMFEEILRGKPHTLSEKEEMIISAVSQSLNAPSMVFEVLNNVDMPSYFKSISDKEGKEIPLTHGSYGKHLESHDRSIRKQAFDNLYDDFKKHRNTLASTLQAHVKSTWDIAKIRGYNSSRESALFGNNIPVNVYDTLLESLDHKMNDVHRFFTLRKKALNVDSMHLYDIYAPIIPDVDNTYTWEEAEELVCTSLKPLGDEYVSKLRKGFKDRWCDRYENKGKPSGAYSSSAYDSPPYILMNFSGTLRDVFTLAHEAGHSMHSLLCQENQPYHDAEYSIFLAEIASTTNELLLLDHMLKTNSDPKMQAYLLNQYLSDFRSTVHRQSMFAEFERDIYARVESGKALSPDYLDKHYYELNKKYLGDAFAWDSEDELIAHEWSRIPHFFYNFYVYQYATGMSASTSIVKDILENGQTSVDNYIKFLSSGGSDHPLNLLQITGVDLSSPKPVNDALDNFRDKLNQLEKLLGEQS